MMSGQRPKQTVHAVPKQRAIDFPPHSPDCPFCRGNEASTPPSILEIPGPDGWALRVIANKFPAVTPASLHTTGSQDINDYAQVFCSRSGNLLMRARI
jgi:galactose-1-phosphate uridylyltransferase